MALIHHIKKLVILHFNYAFTQLAALSRKVTLSVCFSVLLALIGTHVLYFVAHFVQILLNRFRV